MIFSGFQQRPASILSAQHSVCKRRPSKGCVQKRSNQRIFRDHETQNWLELPEAKLEYMIVGEQVAFICVQSYLSQRKTVRVGG
ncbi:hypothetical protein PM082_000160 [Marasmius tenuissimus]|nr:hypothetical protein PM082_000160 [Marasmius tenuissimus]